MNFVFSWLNDFNLFLFSLFLYFAFCSCLLKLDIDIDIMKVRWCLAFPKLMIAYENFDVILFYSMKCINTKIETQIYTVYAHHVWFIYRKCNAKTSCCTMLTTTTTTTKMLMMPLLLLQVCMLNSINKFIYHLICRMFYIYW